jgi:hypothetical protein
MSLKVEKPTVGTEKGSKAQIFYGDISVTKDSHGNQWEANTTNTIV